MEAATEVLIKLASKMKLAQTEPMRTKLTRTKLMVQIKIQQPEELKVLLIIIRY